MDTSFTEFNALFDIEMKPEYFDTLLNNNVEIQPTKRGKKTQDLAYRIGSTTLGTSHLKRHLEHHKGPSKISFQAAGPIKDTPRRCKKYTPQRGSRTASVPVAFDSERCRHEIARMIILHDYPLHMVEHKGFTTFLHNLRPMFNMVDFNTVQADCVATYLSERSTIENLIAQMPGWICLTLDVWNSNNRTGYVFITGQFIDSEWNIHKRLLSVVMELYPESEFAFRDVVSTCLTDWNIFLLTNCLVRALTSVAQETLQACQEMVKKVRECVKYVKASEYFPDLKQLQVLNTRNLSLDDQTKWNTTYEMLLAASELKEEFSRLDTLYPNYFKSPSGEDWNLVDNLCAYLKLIFDTASVMASSSVPTANTFFVEAWNIQLELTRASTSYMASVGIKKRRQGKNVTAIDNYEIAHYCEKKKKMVSEDAVAVLVCSATIITYEVKMLVRVHHNKSAALEEKLKEVIVEQDEMKKCMGLMMKEIQRLSKLVPDKSTYIIDFIDVPSYTQVTLMCLFSHGAGLAFTYELLYLLDATGSTLEDYMHTWTPIVIHL
nr:zinc finger BED domain-containing protein DAYSLEEPER-like [Tanacetum cinerariifolium]